MQGDSTSNGRERSGSCQVNAFDEVTVDQVITELNSDDVLLGVSLSIYFLVRLLLRHLSHSYDAPMFHISSVVRALTSIPGTFAIERL